MKHESHLRPQGPIKRVSRTKWELKVRMVKQTLFLTLRIEVRERKRGLHLTTTSNEPRTNHHLCPFPLRENRSRSKSESVQTDGSRILTLKESLGREEGSLTVWRSIDTTQNLSCQGAGRGCTTSGDKYNSIYTRNWVLRKEGEEVPISYNEEKKNGKRFEGVETVTGPLDLI